MTATVSLTWFDLDALAIESEALRVIVVPELGAKIVSLFDKQSQREWLVGPTHPLRHILYGSCFTEQDMSGWDEIFPTIDPCDYPVQGKYYGRLLPDHGEVWAMPWCKEQSAVDTLAFSVQGKALAYNLLRTISFPAPNILRMDYRVTNIGDEALTYLWAAHPQFAADTETEIILPPEIMEVLNVRSGSKWGEAGQVYAWPQATTLDKKLCSLNRLDLANSHSCRKFYIPPEIRVHWAMLADHHSGRALRLEWSPEDIPYLGIWVDEGVFSSVPVIALEPTSGFYDSLTIAIQNGRVAYLAPGETRHWHLTVQAIGINE